MRMIYVEIKVDDNSILIPLWRYVLWQFLVSAYCILLAVFIVGIIKITANINLNEFALGLLLYSYYFFKIERTLFKKLVKEGDEDVWEEG
jgi:hypothetical protein